MSWPGCSRIVLVVICSISMLKYWYRYLKHRLCLRNFSIIAFKFWLIMALISVRTLFSELTYQSFIPETELQCWTKQITVTSRLYHISYRLCHVSHVVQGEYVILLIVPASIPSCIIRKVHQRLVYVSANVFHCTQFMLLFQVFKVDVRDPVYERHRLKQLSHSCG